MMVRIPIALAAPLDGTGGITALVLAVLALIATPLVTLWVSRKGGKIDRAKILQELQNSVMSDVQEERNAARAELKEVREEVRSLRAEVAAMTGRASAAETRASAAESRADAIETRLHAAEAKAGHFDDEVIALREGIAAGQIPPLPERPIFMVGHA